MTDYAKNDPESLLAVVKQPIKQENQQTPIKMLSEVAS